MAWTDLSFPFGSILTSAKMTQLDDNLDALAAGLSGAPKIQTAALQDDLITSAKIADGAVGTAAIATSAVTANELASNSVGSSEIASGAVGNSEIAAGAVTYDKCNFSNNIVAGDLAANSVGASEIASGAVGNSELATNAVTNVKVSNSTLGAEKFQTGTTERDWVLARTAGASAGAVGTYAFVVPNVNGVSIAFGSTVSGSSLNTASLDNASSSDRIDTGGSLSGTWRCMGERLYRVAGTSTMRATLALRIS